ncbi:hypothetical protein FRC12_015319, partial [Ceratobasidium sp. 428]
MQTAFRYAMHTRIWRLRLGKTLNYEYNEDSQTGLFQRRDPREALRTYVGGPRLDIERALNKLEKVAIRRAIKTGRPLVLVINDIHLFNNDDEGKQLLTQLQQRAERWAESGVVTMLFNTDDFWPYTVMRQLANRMQTFSVKDLDRNDSFQALKRLRRDAVGEEELESDVVLAQAAEVAGGRLSYLSRLARSRDIIHHSERLKHSEKAWLLTHIGLIRDFDDDCMDEQKWSSSSWLLLREFVRRRIVQEEAFRKDLGTDSLVKSLPMPSIPYHECRQIMTRADFLDGLDRLNIISTDTNHEVWLDSMLTLQAAREVVTSEGFEELLRSVLARIEEVESLQRTRELKFKDLKHGDR